MRTRSVVVSGLLLLFPLLLAAQQKKIYLDPNNDFSAYFSSAIHKKQVPVTVTTDPQQADYTAQFQAKASDGSLVDGILTAMGQGGDNIKSFNEVVMTIVDARSKDVAFSYTCRKVSQKHGGKFRSGHLSGGVPRQALERQQHYPLTPSWPASLPTRKRAPSGHI